MNITLKREDLLKSLQSIIGVVERRQTMPILANVLLSCEGNVLTLTATDLEVELISTFNIDSSDSFTTTLPGRKLLDICRSLPEDSILSIGMNEKKGCYYFW